MSETTGHKPFRLTGWHVLAMLVVFFGIIFAVNIHLVLQANRSWTGLVPGNGYEASVKFNKNAAAARAMLAKGWHTTVMIGKDDHIAVVLKDASGNPLSGLEAMAIIGRPAGDREDFTVRLSEKSPGVYGVTQPLKHGGWRIETRFMRGGKLQWRSEAEFIIKPN